MKQNTIAIFFIVLFMGILLAPSILVTIDDSVDVSVFYSLSDEDEEGKGKETNKNLEIICPLINHSELDLASIDSKNNSGYYFKKYPKPHLNLIFPPPELHIL